MQTVRDIAIEIVAREGGYVNDPDDPGGATKFGVTIHTMQRLGLDLDDDGDVDAVDVRQLTQAQAVDIFVRHYYERPLIADLPTGLQASVFDMYVNAGANAVASAFLHRKIGERVKDPAIREKLIPRSHGFGTRRPSVDSGYFEAFNRDNVTLVDIRETPITSFAENGIFTGETFHPLDMVIFATGFDALTGSILKVRIVGRGGITLQEKWAAGPVTHLGVGTAGFPNMLIVAGPGSPSILSNVLVSIEEQIDWFTDLLTGMRARGEVEVEVSEQAEQDWTAHVQERAAQTLYMTAESFYNGSEVAGKPRVFMPYPGGIKNYRRALESCATEGYSGFALRKAPASPGRAKVIANGS
jgi:cyclohexanone monooxygenase